MEHYVYFLRCPQTHEVRYVGLSNCPERRFVEHLMGFCGPKTHRWISSLLRRGLEPVMDVQYMAPSRDRAALAEAMYIAAFRRLGAHLTNLTDGGEAVRSGGWRRRT
jgi:hypothetical protein